MAAHTIPQLRSTTLPPPNSTLERLMSTMPATAPDTAAHHRGAARLPHPLQQCGHEWPKPEGDDVAKRNTGGGHALIKSEGIDRCTNGAEDEPHPNPGVLYDGAGSPTADQRQNYAAHSHGCGTNGCRDTSDPRKNAAVPVVPQSDAARRTSAMERCTATPSGFWVP